MFSVKLTFKKHLLSRFYFTDYFFRRVCLQAATSYGALVVTLAMSLRLINCRFIIIIIIIIIITMGMRISWGFPQFSRDHGMGLDWRYSPRFLPWTR